MLGSSHNSSLQMVRDKGKGTDDETKKAVLTPPLSLDSEDPGSSSSSSEGNYRAPNFLQRAGSLLKNVRPGSDLTHFQIPPLFNLPKSQLQCLGEQVYSIGADDILSRCNNGKSPLDRFTAVVAWSISLARPVTFGVVPFNPILGETHHVTRGTLNLIIEQVSHHPPVTALHGTDEKNNLEMIWYQRFAVKFHGASVEGIVHGTRQLKLLNHGENYVMNPPNFLIRFFPVPRTEWSGNAKIRCVETGLEAELCYGSHSFLGFGGNNRSIKGRIIESATSKTIYKVEGHWDRVVTIRDVVDKGKHTTSIYNGREVLCNLKTPEVKDQKGLCTSESAVVWSEVSQSILNKEWEKASEAKRAVEERQRQLERERKSKGEIWVPKHFNVSKSADKSKDGGYECFPIHKLVPPAPIVAPL